MSRKRFFGMVLISWLLVGLAWAEAEKSAALKKGENTNPGAVARLQPGHVWSSPDGTPLPFRNDDDVLTFLSKAEVVSSKRIGEGLNRTLKVVLEHDGLRMHAAFRQFKGRRYFADPQQQREIPVRDSYLHEVAAYRIGKMLGLSFVPPTVVREIDGKSGSLQAWVENAMMEKERRAANLEPPDEWLWISRMLTMHLFDNLVANTDRHQGNLLIDPTWEVWLIDHTQAFRPIEYLFSGEKVLYCDREVWRRLKALDRKTVEAELDGLVGKSEIKALFRRRDRLVDQIQKLIDQNGADRVLFSLDS